jgi:hypothetical protein
VNIGLTCRLGVRLTGRRDEATSTGESEVLAFCDFLL